MPLRFTNQYRCFIHHVDHNDARILRLGSTRRVVEESKRMVTDYFQLGFPTPPFTFFERLPSSSPTLSNAFEGLFSCVNASDGYGRVRP